MKNAIKQISFYLILSSIVFYLYYKGLLDLTTLKKFTALNFLVLSALHLYSYAMNALSLKINLKYFDIKEKFSLIFHYTNTSNLLNYLPMKAGILSMATYFKVKYNLGINKFVFANILNYLIITISSVLLLFIISFFTDIRLIIDLFNFKTIILYAIIGIVLFLLIKYILKIERLKDFVFIKYLTIFIGNYKIIINKKSDVFEFFIVTIFTIIITAFRYYYFFDILNFEISFIDSLLIAVIANFSFVISFTPGGIGIKEGMIAFSTYLLFGNKEIGLVVSVADRVINLVWTILLGVYSSRKVKKELKL